MSAVTEFLVLVMSHHGWKSHTFEICYSYVEFSKYLTIIDNSLAFILHKLTA